MRSTKSHRNNRRSHHHIDPVALSQCECGAHHQRHRACKACGKYNGRVVIDVVAQTERMQKRVARKQEMYAQYERMMGNPAAAVNEPATSDAAEEKTEIKAKAKTVAKKHRVSKKAAANKE